MDLSTQSDGRLLDLFLQGDQGAFEELLRRHARMVLNVCTRQLRDAHLAEDAAQAVFLTLAHKASSLRSRTDIAGWLHTVSWHVASRGRAAEQHRAKREQRAANMQSREAGSDAEMWNELSPLLDAELQALPEKFQAPLLLHYLEGVSEVDGARRLNVPLGTFSSRLARAREMLRERLTQRGAPVHSAGFALLLLSHAGSAQTTGEFIAATAKAAVWIKSGNAAAAVVSAQTESFLSAAQNALFKTQVKAWAKMAAMVTLILVVALVSLSNAVTQPNRIQPIAAPETRGGPAEKPVQAEFVRTIGGGEFQAPNSVLAVAINADGTQVATGCAEQVLVWDVRTKEVVRRLTGEGYFFDVHWLRDGRLVVLEDGTMGNKGGGVYIWNPVDDSRKWLLPNTNYNLFNVRKFELSADQSTVLVASGKRDDQGDTLNAIDVGTGRTVFVLPGITRSVPNVTNAIQASALSHDAKRVFCVDITSGARNGANADFSSTRLFVWDLAAKKVQTEWMLPKGTQFNHTAQPRWIGDAVYFEARDARGECTLIYNTDTGVLAKRLPGIGVYDFAGKCWVLFSKSRVNIVNDGEEKPSQSFAVGDIPWLKGLSISPDGRWLVGSTNTQAFLLVDLKERKHLAPDFRAHTHTPYTMMFAPDGRLCVYDGSALRLYDGKTGAEIQNFNGSSYSLYGRNSFAPDGRMFVQVGGQDGRPQVWDSARGELLGHLAPHSGGGCGYIQISPDGSQVLTIGAYDGVLQLQDLQTGRALAQWKGLKHPFFRNVLHLDSAHWATLGAGDAAISRLFLADATPQMFGSHERTTPELQKTIGLSGAYDPNTSGLLYRFKDDAGKDVECIKYMQICAFRDLAYFNAVAIDPVTSLHKERTGLWRASTGKFIRSVDSPGAFVRFSPDGKRVIGTDAIVDVDTGKTIAKFPGAIYRCVSPSGTLVAEVGNTLRILDTRTGEELWRHAFVGGPKKYELGMFGWSADETAVAIVWKNACPVTLVKLFQHERVAEQDLTPAALAEAAKELSSSDAARVLKAQALLIQAGSAALPLLKNDPSAIYVLEAIARDSGALKAPAADILREIASGTSPRSGQAIDALLRLKAIEVQIALGEALKNPAKLQWPQKEKQSTGEF